MISNRSTAFCALATGMALLLLAGCAGSPKPPKPEPLSVSITGSDALNPRSDGTPQRVDLMIFQLAAAANFNDATLFDLYPQPAKARDHLGVELIGVDKLQIAPGTEQKIVLEIADDARYIGALAAFEDIDTARWRDLAEIRDETLKDKLLFRNRKMQVSLHENSLTLAFD